jgi:UTP:GlnB (protein PII) uridylyltransferase
MLVGLGMLPRGEVGLIFATIGLNSGVLGDDLYAALLLVVLATTLGTPMLLRARYQALARRPGADDDAEPGDPEPPGGWFAVRDGTFDLAARPGADRTLELALGASRLAADLDPAGATLDWFADHRNAPLAWSSRATDDFLGVLRDGDVRSWRFLEALGVLPRAFPELADALRDRHADPSLLDASGLHRWTTLERLHDLARRPAGAAEWERARDRDALRLAAFLVDLLRDRDDRVPVTHTVAERLELGPRTEALLSRLVDDPTALLVGARRRAPFEHEAIVQLAAHYGDPETLRGALLLALASTDDAFDHERVQELYQRVLDLLRSASWRGDATDIVQQRRAEAESASDGSDAVRRRIADAPRRYVLAERPRRIARHAAMLATWSRRGPDRYLVTVDPPSRHDERVGVTVVGPDSPGLFARVAHVLARSGLDVENAIVATWPDGCALESFLVRATADISADAIRDAVRAADAAPILVEAVPGAILEFDDSASPWSTMLHVRAPDAPGLLGAVTGAIAAAGVEVHAAEIGERHGIASDTFELSCRGVKLAPADRAAITENLRLGVVLDARRGTLGRAWDRLLGSWSSASGQATDVNK